MRNQLGEELTEPIGAPDLAMFQLVDMFTSCTSHDVKDTILKSFCCVDSHLRVVIATAAFGMGLDCPNVHRVIHCGPPEDIKLYLQETGWAGHDGLQAQAILYHGGPDLSTRHLNEDMKMYCSSKEVCKRKLVLRYFDSTEDATGPDRTYLYCDIYDQ